MKKLKTNEIWFDTKHELAVKNAIEELKKKVYRGLKNNEKI